MVRLNSDGTVDNTFNAGTGFIGVTTIIPGAFTNVAPPVISAMLETPQGLLLGGSFESINGRGHTNIVRLTSTGAVDSTFAGAADNSVLSITPLPSGKYLITGTFAKVRGTARKGVAVINADGSLDTSFNLNWGSLIPGAIRAAAIQPDGKIVVGGGILTLSGGLSAKLAARLNADGSVDSSFTPPGVNTTVEFASRIIRQSTGKLVVIGGFNTVNGSAHHSIVRLNADGSVDSTWPGTGIGTTGLESADAIAAAADGTLYLGGKMSTYNGVSLPGIARLSADGVPDTSFGKPAGSSTFMVGSLALQPDGKVLIGGIFTLGTSTDSTKILLRLSTTVIGPPPAPTITKQPADATVNLGGTADFAVEASGTPPLSYQWLFNQQRLQSEANPALHLTGVASNNIGAYQVIVTNAGGSVTSAVARLNVVFPAHITIPPASQSVIVSNQAAFTVTVSGTAPFAYQWRKNGTNIANATNSIFEIPAVRFADAGAYSVTVSNPAGSDTSPGAQLTVLEQPLKLNGPASVQVTLPDTNIAAAVLVKRSLCLTITGALPPWISAGNYCISFSAAGYASPAMGALSNASSGTFSTGIGTAPPATLIQFDRFFPDGTPAILTLLPNGIYEFNKASLVADQNGHWSLNPPFVPPNGPSATFTVTASGTGPFQYQWRKDGHPISGATNSTLSLTNIQRGDLGTYTVVVSTATQSMVSDPAALTEAGAATGLLGFEQTRGVLTLSWGPGDKLQSAPSLFPASWADVNGATSPYVVAFSTSKTYYRVVPK